MRSSALEGARPCETWSAARLLPDGPKPLRTFDEPSALRRLQAVEVCTFDQCCVGCQGRKPTTMALLRLHPFVVAIRALGNAGRCAHAPGTHPRLQGRDESGNFCTAIAKIYPPRLKQLLADAICHGAHSLSGVLPTVEPLAPELYKLNRMDFEVDRVQPRLLRSLGTGAIDSPSFSMHQARHCSTLKGKKGIYSLPRTNKNCQCQHI